MTPLLAFAALALEVACGYPPALYAAIGHPVTWIGALIDGLERAGNRDSWDFARRRAGGIVALVLLLSIVAGLSWGLVWLLHVLTGWLFDGWLTILLVALLASSLVAQRSLDDHVTAVAEALETGGVEAGRRAVGMIVGRDTAALDSAGVARAAVESLAENFADGVVAPVFWMVVGGLPGSALYKAINTADSMIGHRSERYLAFGWAAARLDDLVNLPASRLAALWLTLATLALPGASAGDAVRAVWRDSSRHKSPNAGWPEAAMAGALGYKLAGPRIYSGKLIHDDYMGDGRADLTAADIRRSLGLYRVACLIQAAVVSMLAFALAP